MTLFSTEKQRDSFLFTEENVSRFSTDRGETLLYREDLYREERDSFSLCRRAPFFSLERRDFFFSTEAKRRQTPSQCIAESVSPFRYTKEADERATLFSTTEGEEDIYVYIYIERYI